MWHGVTCTFIKFLLLLPALLFKNCSSAPAWSVPAARALLLLPHAQRQREPQQIPFTGQTGVSCTTGKPAACPNVGCSRLFPASTSAQFRPAGTPPRPCFAAWPGCRGGTTGGKEAQPPRVHSRSAAGSATRPAYRCACRLLRFTQVFTRCPVLLFSRSSNSMLHEGLDVFAFHYCDRSLLCLRCLGRKYRLRSTSQRADPWRPSAAQSCRALA